MLLYMLQVPKINGNAEIIQIFPLLVNNTIITGVPSYVLKSGDKIFTTEKPDEFVQQTSFIKTLEDRCIKSLFFGQESHCNVKIQYHGFTQLISNDKMLISKTNHTLLSSNCGPDDRILHGNFLISFYNCSLQIDNCTYTNNEITIEPPLILGAFPGLQINRTILHQHNLSYIGKQMMENRNQIEHIKFKQYRSNTWLFSIFGGVSSSIIIFIIIIILFFRKKRITIKIKQLSQKGKINGDRASLNPTSKRQHQGPQKPARRTDHQAEDDLFPPPEELHVEEHHQSAH